MPTVLCKVIKLLGVLIHRTVPLTQFQKLDKLAVDGTRGQLVTMESNRELIP
jgi:hypothetical protein